MSAQSPLIFLPEHQQQASQKLNASIAKAAQKVLDDQHNGVMMTMQERLGILRNAIADAIREWFREYPMLTKLNIDFRVEFNPINQKVTIVPSFDLQRLMAGVVTI